MTVEVLDLEQLMDEIERTPDGHIVVRDKPDDRCQGIGPDSYRRRVAHARAG